MGDDDIFFPDAVSRDGRLRFHKKSTVKARTTPVHTMTLPRPESELLNQIDQNIQVLDQETVLGNMLPIARLSPEANRAGPAPVTFRHLFWNVQLEFKPLSYGVSSILLRPQSPSINYVSD